MFDSISPQEDNEESSSGFDLAKLAIILAVTAGVAFGLCTVSAFGAGKYVGYITGTAMVIEAICILGLIVIAIIAMAKILVNAFRGK